MPRLSCPPWHVCAGFSTSSASTRLSKTHYKRASTRVVGDLSESSVCHCSLGLDVKLRFSTFGRGRNIFLDIPLYRTGGALGELGVSAMRFTAPANLPARTSPRSRP